MKEDRYFRKHVIVFGLVAGLATLVSAAVLIYATTIFPAHNYLKILGYIWIAFALLFFLGVAFFELGKKRAASTILLVFGFIGLIFGVGFFLASILTIFTGWLIFKEKIAEKRKKRISRHLQRIFRH